MTTAIIPRPSDAPKLWVLELDGHRQKYVQRGEGRYYLNTNQPPKNEYKSHGKRARELPAD